MKEMLVSIYVCAEVCRKEQQGKSVKGTDWSELHWVGSLLCQNPNETSEVQSDVTFKLAHIPRILEILLPLAGTTPNIVPAING